MNASKNIQTSRIIKLLFVSLTGFLLLHYFYFVWKEDWIVFKDVVLTSSKIAVIFALIAFMAILVRDRKKPDFRIKTGVRLSLKYGVVVAILWLMAVSLFNLLWYFAHGRYGM